MPSKPCKKCGLLLPLRPPGADEQETEWSCVQCGTKCHGVLDTDAPNGLWGNVRPVDYPDLNQKKDPA